MYDKLIKEWWKAEEIPVSPRVLFKGKDFKQFLEITKNMISNTDKTLVNSSLFLLTDGIEILGAIDIRHHINHPNLIEIWWHMWYWIAPKHRKKWYATKMLELWLIEAKKLWLKRILITCHIDNIWSNKVIIKNWWVFERISSKRISKDWYYNRYWFNL